MNFKQKIFGVLISVLCICTSALFGADEALKSFPPVNPNASPEAVALLEFLYSISGKYTLTGQHNYPNTRDRNSQFAAEYIGKTPAVWSIDMGHAAEGSDSYLARPDIVEEAIRQHKLGSIITICWHAVPPTTDEPGTFRPKDDADTQMLSSVQGQLLDEQFKDILTPGTALYKKWCEQVDTIAFYLKQLQDAKVPVLWRPYHEMNGEWFWWGGRRGEYSTEVLYRQMFDRYVNYHKLNNLIWIWSVDKPLKPERQFVDYFPGIEYMDILSLDVYGNDFNQDYYDGLIALSEGKPLALAEVGNPPSLEILEKQPKWTMYVVWANMVRNTLKKQYQVLVNSPRVISLEDAAYWYIVNPYRIACGLPELPFLKDKNARTPVVNFSGRWILNEEKTIAGIWGISGWPYKFDVTHKRNELMIEKTFIVEYDNDRTEEEKIFIDSEEPIKSKTWWGERSTTANWSEKGDMLIVQSTYAMTRDGKPVQSVSTETWSLKEKGKVLCIEQFSSSPWGDRKITVFFDRDTKRRTEEKASK